MSEKEILDIIKDFLQLKEIHSTDSMSKSFLSVYKEAIQGLLDLYNKEKEKNKELENTDLTTVYMDGFYDGEKKWKDKIREKLEQLKKDMTKREESLELFYRKRFCFEILQELLEEE